MCIKELPSIFKQEKKYMFVYKDRINCKPSFPPSAPFVLVFNCVAGIKTRAGENSCFLCTHTQGMGT